MARIPSEELKVLHERTLQHKGRLAPTSNGRDRLRLRLYREQKGHCYWLGRGQCRFKNVPMSLERTFISEQGRVKLNPRFASFEHVIRKYDGGTDAASNMALAHVACNCHREKFLAPNTRPKKIKQKEVADAEAG